MLRELARQFGSRPDAVTHPLGHLWEQLITPRHDLPGLVALFRRIKNGPDGAPLSYKFHHKNSGRQIQDAQTLAEAQVRDGDVLRLQPEITAGS